MVDNRHPTPPAPPARPTQPSPPASTRPAEPAKHEPPGKLPPVGHKDYVAGQPVDEEEQQKTESDRDAVLKAAEEKRKAAEAKAHREEPKAHDDPDKDKHAR